MVPNDIKAFFAAQPHRKPDFATRSRRNRLVTSCHVPWKVFHDLSENQAATFDREWNTALLAVEQAEAERERHAKIFGRVKTDEQSRRIKSLARDFATAWESQAHENADRKWMLALSVEDVTLTRMDRFVSIQLRMRAGKTVELEPDTAENRGRDRPTHRGHGRPGHRGNPKPARLHRQPGKPLIRITVAYLRIFSGCRALSRANAWPCVSRAGTRPASWAQNSEFRCGRCRSAVIVATASSCAPHSQLVHGSSPSTI